MQTVTDQKFVMNDQRSETTGIIKMSETKEIQKISQIPETIATTGTTQTPGIGSPSSEIKIVIQEKIIITIIIVIREKTGNQSFEIPEKRASPEK